MTRPEHNPDAPYPTLDRLRIVAAALADRVLPTPVTQWQTGVITNALSADTQVWLKLELFQKTGTFKVRGALNNLDHLTDQQREQGVVTVSAGNHAIALAYTAQLAGISAQVVM
ncbi:MAG: pyridoxal-phosphate dependent enzyme, partial [Natronospirillum sp.]